MEFRPTASKLLQNSSSFKVSVCFLCCDVLGDDGDDVHDIEVSSSSTFEVSVCFLCDDVLGDDGDDVHDIEHEVISECHVGRSD